MRYDPLTKSKNPYLPISSVLVVSLMPTSQSKRVTETFGKTSFVILLNIKVAAVIVIVEDDSKDCHGGDDGWAQCLCWRASGHIIASTGSVILAVVQRHNRNILGYANLITGQFNAGGRDGVRINVIIWTCTIIGDIVAGGHPSGPNWTYAIFAGGSDHHPIIAHEQVTKRYSPHALVRAADSKTGLTLTPLSSTSGVAQVYNHTGTYGSYGLHLASGSS
jgi:hypothetical protein